MKVAFIYMSEVDIAIQVVYPKRWNTTERITNERMNEGKLALRLCSFGW